MEKKRKEKPFRVEVGEEPDTPWNNKDSCQSVSSSNRINIFTRRQLGENRLSKGGGTFGHS